MKHDEETLRRAADWSGMSPTPSQIDTLGAYADWLIGEAIPAGAVGPDEGPRIVDRHVADSLVFAAAWRGKAPASLVDVGSGAGLPGIPLAIAFPAMSVVLLDRSQRRTDLAGRAAHILELDNVEAIEGQARRHQRRYAAATFRGSLSPAQAIAAAPALLESGGIAVIGLHRGELPPQNLPGVVPDESYEILETPKGVLDSAAWHLRMTAT